MGGEGTPDGAPDLFQSSERGVGVILTPVLQAIPLSPLPCS